MKYHRKYVRKRTSSFERKARQTYKERFKQISFLNGYDYDGDILPFVNFYKFLAKKKGSFMSNKFDSL